MPSRTAGMLLLVFGVAGTAGNLLAGGSRTALVRCRISADPWACDCLSARALAARFIAARGIAVALWHLSFSLTTPQQHQLISHARNGNCRS